MLVSDASSATSPNTMKIIRRVGGINTTLDTQTINFVRGTFHTVKVSLIGAVIQTWFDGVLVNNITDANPFLTAGNVGFYNNGGDAYWQTIVCQPQGDDLTGKNVYTRLRLGSTDPTVTPIVQDLQITARSPDIQSGVVIPTTDYSYKNQISGCLDDAASQSNYWWKIGCKQNENKKFFFQNRAGMPSPWPLASANGDILLSTRPKLTHQAPKYRNRQYITGAIDIVTVVESKKGDGINQSWALKYPVDSITSIFVNGQVRTFGILNTDTGKNYYFTQGDKNLGQDSSNTPLASTETLTITYKGQKPYIAQADNVAQQIALALVNGTTGIVEAVENVQGITKAAADTLAQARITQYAILARDWNFTTKRTGLSAGQMLSVFVPEVDIIDGNFLITQVKTTVKQNADGSLWFLYDVSCSEGPLVGNWTQLFALN